MKKQWWIAALAILAGTHSPTLWAYQAQLKPLTPAEQQIQKGLMTHINKLAVGIGERNVAHYSSLQDAAGYIESTLRGLGYKISANEYSVGDTKVRNIEAQITGIKKPTENVVVGAHYDSAPGTPGADDNGSGTAAVLELARLLKNSRPNRTIRLVLFANEEPPYFQTPMMGSLVYAQQLHNQHVNVTAMLSLETIAYYSDAKGSQHYPVVLGPAYPDVGNFIGFAGNTESGPLVRRAVELFKQASSFPVEGLAAPAEVKGIGFSDQWSFWQNGYRAIMVTDTAPFRYPYYHHSADTPDKVDLKKTARVVAGVKQVVLGLANE